MIKVRAWEVCFGSGSDSDRNRETVYVAAEDMDAAVDLAVKFLQFDLHGVGLFCRSRVMLVCELLRPIVFDIASKDILADMPEVVEWSKR